MGLPALPTAGVPEDGGDCLRLTRGRPFAHFHAFQDHSRALPTLAAREDTPGLWIAPGDAKDRDVRDDDPIELFNARGVFAAQAKLTPRRPQGAVRIRDGWAGLNVPSDGAAVLPEAALSTFPFSVGQANFGVRVKIRPIRPAD